MAANYDLACHDLIGGTRIWSSTQNYHTNFIGNNTAIDLYNGSIIYTIKVSGLNGRTWSIKRPSVAWINQIRSTFKIKDWLDGGKEKVLRYVGTTGIGLAGYVKQLSRLSKNKFDAEKNIQFLEGPQVITKEQIQIEIPLRYVLDIASAHRWITMLDIEMQFTYDSESNIFELPDGAYAEAVNTQITYPLCEFDDPEVFDPRELLINNTETHVVSKYVPAGSTSVSGSVTIPFNLRKLLVSEFTNTRNDIYNMCPNPENAPTVLQLNNGGGVIIPRNPNFKGKNDTTNETLLRLYNSYKLTTMQGGDQIDTHVTYDNWKQKYRIYGLTVGYDKNNGASWNYEITYDEPTKNAVEVVFMFMGEQNVPGL